MNFLDIYWLVSIFLMALCFGSFLNVCIYRIPLEISLSHPPSTCPKCKTRIKWYDNVPLFGWLALGGKCRNCKAPISIQYPAVELLFGLICAGLWVLHGIYSGEPGAALCYCLLAFGLLLGTFIDLAEMWLPDRVTIGGMIAGPILSMLIPELHGAEGWLDGLIASLIGLAAGYGTFWLLRVGGTAAFKQEAMGMGDVKLMGALGAFLGWHAILFVTFFSAAVGAVVGITLIAMKKREMQSRIPFGPYIAMAAFLWMFGGDRLWDAYLRFVGM